MGRQQKWDMLKSKLMDTLGLAPAVPGRWGIIRGKERALVQQVSDKFWQAEARTEETKGSIRDIKRATRRKFTAEEKIGIVVEGFRRDTPIRDLCRREGTASARRSFLQRFVGKKA